MSAAAVVVDVWSDYVCPFFCLEEPVFEEVRKKYGDRIDVRWPALFASQQP